MTTKTKATAQGLFETAAEPWKEVGKTLEAARDRAVERNRELNLRIIEIAETNTREVFGAARAAAGASSLSELFEIQNSFVRDQVTRSTTQLRELGELIFTASKDAWQPITSKLTGATERTAA